MFEEILQLPDVEHTWQTPAGWKKILTIFDRYYPGSEALSGTPNA